VKYVGEPSYFYTEYSYTLIINMVRLYISGLPRDVTEEDLKDLFKSFGQIEKVSFARFKDKHHFCRGFAHFELRFSSDHDQNRCIRLYDGCEWKKKRIKLELAKAHFTERRQNEARNFQYSNLYTSLATQDDVKIQCFKNEPLIITGRVKNTCLKINPGNKSLIKHFNEKVSGERTSTAPNTEAHDTFTTDLNNTSDHSAEVASKDNSSAILQINSDKIVETTRNSNNLLDSDFFRVKKEHWIDNFNSK
jgi:RNA recognition motif-containing protein